jgi:hypothetical protein
MYSDGHAYFSSVNDGAGTSNLIIRTTGTGTRGDIIFSPNATQTMTIKNDGKVGIGTTAPAYKLDVNGNGNFNGNLSVTGNITASTGYKVGTSTGLTASYNCTSYPNVTITGGIITGWAC